MTGSPGAGSKGPLGWLRAQLANLTTLMALLPVLWVLGPGGAAALPAALILADLIDSLDGVIARRLGTSSAFGAQLDRICDAAVHAGLTALVAAQLPGPWILAGLPAMMAIAVRLTRQSVGEAKATGSSTNELLRHLALGLLLVQLGAPPLPLIPLLLLAHAATMLLRRPMPFLVRRWARDPLRLLVFYGLLAAPLAAPLLAIPIGGALGLGWLASVIHALGRQRAP